MRVLLAEDDAHVATITKICLERIGGHSVVVCTDGAAAVEEALRAPYELILLDGMMPKKDGLQVARELKAAGLTTPVVFLSARTDARELEDFHTLGAGFIQKPFDPQSICTRIDELLASSRRSGEK